MKLNQQIVEDDAPKICSLCNKEITARTAIGITERDKDNIWASVVKITNDALQWIGVIPEDNEKTVESVVRPQIRVKRRKDVRVEISLISYPSDVVFNTFIERMVGSNSLNTARSKSQKIKVVFHRRAKK